MHGREPKEISAFNISSYYLEGGCTERGQPVNIFFNEGQADAKSKIVTCNASIWRATLDLTGLKTNPAPLKITHKKAGATSETVFTKTPTLTFLCPPDYIHVPKLSGYTRRDFCVSKWEQAIRLRMKRNPKSILRGLMPVRNARPLPVLLKGPLTLLVTVSGRPLPEILKGWQKTGRTPRWELN